MTADLKDVVYWGDKEYTLKEKDGGIRTHKEYRNWELKEKEKIPEKWEENDAGGNKLGYIGVISWRFKMQKIERFFNWRLKEIAYKSKNNYFSKKKDG